MKSSHSRCWSRWYRRGDRRRLGVWPGAQRNACEEQNASYPVSSSASQVTGAKAETLDQLVYGFMPSVNEFPTPLADHPIRPGQGIRVHATADAMGRFVDGTRETGVLQGESGVESRNSRSDDGDVCHVSSPLEAHKSWMHIRHEDALTSPDACSPAG